jgi:glucan 1,3-beta-glucosidase
VFAAAFTARRAPLRQWPWAGVAAMALGAGILVGWAIENVPLESLTFGDWLRSSTMVGLAILAPLIAAAALARGVSVPSFARVLGPAALRPKGVLAVALGLALLVLCVVAVQVALGLVFDPRYKDFPFAPLTAAAIPYGVLACVAPQGQRGTVETLFAALLGACAVYVALNEGFANWQALWLAAVFVGLAVSLLRVRDAPGSA